MLKFLHTSDWQLGISRSFLDAGVAERYAHDRLEAVRRMGNVAREADCAFMLVCGDVFESNLVGRKTVVRALSAMADARLPVYLLPANHDPLTETSVYRSSMFLDNKPANVAVLINDEPIQIADGIELHAAPWRAKRHGENPLAPLLRRLTPTPDGTIRIIAAHGEVDALAPMFDSDALLSLAQMEQAIARGSAHYIALGDKHSFTQVGASGKICYSGTPEPTAFREPNPGHAAVVAVSPDVATVDPVDVGTWMFTELARDDLAGDADVQDLLDQIAALPNKERHVLRLRVGGVLGLAEAVRLRGRLGELHDLYASFECDESQLHVGGDLGDPEAAGLTGFSAATARRLQEMAAGSGDAVAARDALLLLTMLCHAGKDETGQP